MIDDNSLPISRPDKQPWKDLKAAPFDGLPPFPSEALPPVIRDICESVADVANAPYSAVVAGCLSVIGFAIGGKYRVRITGTASVRANIYAWCFMEAGERKSTILNPLTKPVENWVSEWEEKYQETAFTRRGILDEIKDIEKKISKFGTDELDREEMRKRHSELNQKLSKIPPSPSFFVDETTPEAAAIRMSLTGGRLAIFTDEGRQFLNIVSGLYAGGKPQDGLLLRSFDGGNAYRIDRVLREPITIPDPTLGMFLMCQNDWLTKLGGTPDFFHSGLISRVMFCVPDALAGETDESGDLIRQVMEVEDGLQGEEAYEKLVKSLLNVAYLKDTPTMVYLDPDSWVAWKAYHDELERSLGRGEEWSKNKDVAQRLPHLPLRLALILATARAGTGLVPTGIDVATIHNAIKIATYYTHHLRRAVRLMGKTGMPPEAHSIRRYLKKRPHIQAFKGREIQRGCNWKSIEKTERGLLWLVDEGVLALKPLAPKGKKTSQEYVVNPTLHGT